MKPAFFNLLPSNCLFDFAALLQTFKLVCKQANIKFWMTEKVKDWDDLLGAQSDLEQGEIYCKLNIPKICEVEEI